MPTNPFLVTKAEQFNHSYEQLALLMQFKAGVADVLLSNTNVFIEGSRGSGKSMYLRLLSHPIKFHYEKLSREGKVDSLPPHKPYLGVYAKLSPTIFFKHEFENIPRFRELFQQLFNFHCAEQIVNTLSDVRDFVNISYLDGTGADFVQNVKRLLLSNENTCIGIEDLFRSLQREKMNILQSLNSPPYDPDERSQPDILWLVTGAVTQIEQFVDMRVHLLLDEYDSLSEFQQKIINSYLRKRDFPLTFKIACKKHSLVLDVAEGRPLNPSGDFDRVELDDDEFGSSSTYKSYLEAIANKRLRNDDITIDIRTLLGPGPKRHRARTPRQYGGFDLTAMLSSGIVRIFLELCRDAFSRCELGDNGQPLPVNIRIQDQVIKQHAAKKWNALARDQSARPELQTLISRVAELFKLRSQSGVENQIIRLEIIDFDNVSSFSRMILDQALEYEALVQPNRERLQKNREMPSRGYLLHRLLCVHFRLEPESRWDVEISSGQLENLILGTVDTIQVAKEPTKSRPPQIQKRSESRDLFEERRCPILDQECPESKPTDGLGFLSCRLPEAGKIRDAIYLIKNAFLKIKMDHTSTKFELQKIIRQQVISHAKYVPRLASRISFLPR